MKLTTIILVLFFSTQVIFAQQQLVIAGAPDVELHAKNFMNYTPEFTGRVMDMKTGTLRDDQYHLTFRKEMVSDTHMIVTWKAEGNLGGSNQVRQDVFLERNPRILSLPENGDWRLIDGDESRPVDLEWEDNLLVDHYTSLRTRFEFNGRIYHHWHELPRRLSLGRHIITVIVDDKDGHTATADVVVNVVRDFKRA